MNKNCCGTTGFPLGWLIIGIVVFVVLLSGKALPQTNQRAESVGFRISNREKAIDFYKFSEKVSEAYIWG